MSNGDDPILDPQAVLRSFSSSFRGYESEQVDAHLRAIADALRSRPQSAPVDDGALAEATQRIEELERALRRAEADRDAALADAAAAPVVTEAEPFDEGRAMQLLGEETTRVLETARQSAATIVANAEADAQRRTADVDAMQAKVNAELADQRKTTDTELADLRSRTETELAESRAAADRRAETIVADATAEADRLAEGAAAATAAAREEADGIRADAETEAARMRAEAEADVLAAQESAKETARSMVVEAQRVRERVLEDLVARRRQGRQQVDQAKAARDRLARALADVRRQLDDSIKELDVAVPEAKAAVEALATPEPPTDDAAQIKELEAELDAASGRAPAPEPVVATGSAALAPNRNRQRPEPEPVAEAPDTSAVDEAAPADTIVAESATSPDQSAAPAVVEETQAPADDSTADDDEVDVPEIDVPDVFTARDVAMTRHGADLRRKLKRVMADEQSDLLDRLQRSKAMSVDDLAPADEQRQRYTDAVTPAILATAELGADLQGGTSSSGAVAPLVENLVASVFDPLRARVEDSVRNAADAEEVLEPLRAHYRDMRLSEVPDLTDDVLSEAFALGVYEAIPAGTSVQWLNDPRVEPAADCYDDTLADDVVTPSAFPDGRKRPGTIPGCRCLVVPVE